MATDAGNRFDARRPLSGIRVLDLSTVFMAPYCAQILADWGADVVKIEAPEGDTIRAINQVDGNGLGPIFINANHGKRSVVLDLKNDAAQKTLQRMVSSSDVLLHNIRPAAARRLALGPDTLQKINPGLVHCAFRGYGDGGPYAEWPAYDDVIQAASGVASAQASDGSPPAYWRSSAADKIVGLYGAAAICAALQARSASGRGTAVEVPMFETMVSFMLLDRQGGWVAEPPNGPTGYARTDSEYRRPYQTTNGYLAVLIYTDRHWQKFFSAVGHPELIDDPRYETIESRTKVIDQLYRFVEDELRVRSTEDCVTLLRDADIPHGPVNSIEDLFTDPHLEATGFFRTLEQPGLGTIRLARPPIAFDRPFLDVRPAPRLGENTRDVLEEFGFSSAEIDELIQVGAAGEFASATERASWHESSEGVV